MTGKTTLDADLARRLIPFAPTAPDLRFLASTLPTHDLGQQVLTRVRSLTGPVDEVEELLARRDRGTA